MFNRKHFLLKIDVVVVKDGLKSYIYVKIVSKYLEVLLIKCKIGILLNIMFLVT